FFTGTLQRKSTSEFSVEDGDFTLCDCGDNPPSWKVGASRIDVNLNEDAIAWWPQFYISPFGLLDPLPITPPLLPIRIPLKNRATGFLAPGIQFLSDSRWPTIDLPFFIPLGRSYDLTLTPGMRLDWRDTTESGIGAYGSPQLESRLRYAPARSHNGELSAAWTHDSVHGFAKNLEITSPSTDAEQALWDLQDRVHLKWEHDSRFGDTKRWLMDAEWMSDDRYLRDFRVSVDERVAAYLPSRTTFLVRDPVFSSLSQVDYLLALQNPDNALSNLGGAESETPHRLGTAVYLHPQSLGAGLFTHGQASLWQFGPLAGGKSAEIVSSDARAGLSFADSLGPLRLRAESTVGGSYIHRPGQADDSRWTFGHSDAQASLRLARRYSELWHILEPQLRISSLIWKSEAVADNSWNESLQTDDYS
ncbi:LPS-assembly protein LptD, partial [Myxococcota bacterium]|nr:LPS-assembly protein LptD [Myxococcota bacterium]